MRAPGESIVGIYTAAVLLAVGLLGCWRPDPWTPPPPPPEAVEALAPADVGPDDAPPAEGADADDAEAPEAPEDDGDDAPEAPPEPPVVPLARPWAARLLQVPATLVDDAGTTLVVIGARDTPLEVRAEQPHRVKVWCASCSPPTEGWIQAQIVAPAE